MSHRSFGDQEAESFVRRYNATPQAELLGLSPDELGQLLDGDWRTVGAVRLNPALEPDQVAQAWAYRAGLDLLRLIQERGPAGVTATGNLNRQFVATALDAVEFPAGFVEQVREMNKVVNEDDVWLLQDLRLALVAAGYLRRQRGFRVTAEGRAVIEHPTETAGRFFLRLFLARTGLSRSLIDSEGTWFRSPVGPALYLLSRHARDWVDPEALAERILLPHLLSESTSLQLEVLAYSWVIHPCVEFGLLEQSGGLRMLDPRSYRTSRLFGEFVRFRFDRDR
jgi:hypothetical protein